MESLNPLIFTGIVACAFLLIGAYILMRAGRSEPRSGESPLMLMQREIEELRGQLGQTLEASAARTQSQLTQILNHVGERLRENTEMLQQGQQHLGERLDGAAHLVVAEHRRWWLLATY